MNDLIIKDDVVPKKKKRGRPKKVKTEVKSIKQQVAKKLSNINKKSKEDKKEKEDTKQK